MRAGKGVTKRLLGVSELSYLRYGMRLDAASDVQKRALQTLCEYYEAGRRIAEPSDIRQMIHSHIGSSYVLVRRWAIKALALIGHPDDFPRIVERLRVETDVEAQAWGMTGLVKNAQERGLNELCAMTNLPKSSAITLAARLYAPSRWLEKHAEQVRISLHDDELTLKWATFLIGYGKAPEDLFHPRHSNEVFLGELNVHDAADICEYSIWALWARKEFGAGFSKIPLLEARQHPESVRKWLYRLATKSPSKDGLDAAALADLRSDNSYRARDGLALGVADLDPSIFATEVLEWYTVESNGQVRDSLLESMATRSAENVDYADAVEQRFRVEQADSAVRRRLLAASEGTKLYGNLQRIHIEAERIRQGLLEFNAQGITVQGDLNVTGPTLNVGGSLIAQNVAVGDMINSANAAVQQLQSSDPATAEILQKVLETLAALKVEPGREEVTTAIERVANSPSPETKNWLLEKITNYGAKAAALGTALGGLDKLIEAVRQIPY